MGVGKWWEVGEEKGPEKGAPALLVNPRETRKLNAHGNTPLGLRFVWETEGGKSCGFRPFKADCGRIRSLGANQRCRQEDPSQICLSGLRSPQQLQLSFELPAPQSESASVPLPSKGSLVGGFPCRSRMWWDHHHPLSRLFRGL